MTPSRVHGPYALYDALQALGSGAAASVHLGVARDSPSSRPVAIKRLHAGQARQSAAVARLLDEVRLTRNIVHPNVVRTIDFVSDGEEMLAVMEYVHGEPLSRLLADVVYAGAMMPLNVALRIACDVLSGLEAAHHARDAEGQPLMLVHRDVTPENILVGADGVARLMDFGVAKAEGRLHATRDGGIRGKLAYLAPEQVGGDVTARTDLYATGLVIWEMLVGARAIKGENEAELLMAALEPKIEAPSTRRPDLPPTIDVVIARALAKNPDDRYTDAAEQATAFKRAAKVATAAEVSEWVHQFGGERLADRAENVQAMLATDTILFQGGPPPSSGSGSYTHALSHSQKVPLYHPDSEDDPTAVAGAQHLRPSGEAPVDDGDRGHLIGLTVMVAVALTVLGLGLMWRRHDSAATEAGGGPSVEESASALPGVAIAPVIAPPIASPIASPSMPTISPSSLPAAPTATAPERVRGPIPKARPATKNCDPPWTLDANGIRRYDPACVK